MQKTVMRYFINKINNLNLIIVLSIFFLYTFKNLNFSLRLVFLKLFKSEENFEAYSSHVEIEANKIALDISKEEKDYLKMNKAEKKYINFINA